MRALGFGTPRLRAIDPLADVGDNPNPQMGALALLRDDDPLPGPKNSVSGVPYLPLYLRDVHRYIESIDWLRQKGVIGAIANEEPTT